MTDALTRFEPEWVSPPGDTIADLLEEKGWSQAELATRTGFTRKHINELISGKTALTPETALRLEATLGGKASFWLSREARYQERCARQAAVSEYQQSAAWLDELPLTEMIRFGWVERLGDPGLQVAECLRFFGVASVDAWRERFSRRLAAFRASAAVRQRTGSIAAWLQQGERAASAIECAEFDPAAFRKLLPRLRALTLEADPEKFVPELVDDCRARGVAIVFVKTPKGCPASGAVRWLSSSKAVLQLSLRYKTNDHLWFTVFHECAHLILHARKLLFLEGDDLNEVGAKAFEDEANQFACDTLIPPRFAVRLPQLHRSAAAITDFARVVGVAPGIIVGRMQKDEIVPWSHFNALKVRYGWADANR